MPYNLRNRKETRNYFALDDEFESRGKLRSSTARILRNRPDTFCISGWTRMVNIKLFQSKIIQEAAGQDKIEDHIEALLCEMTIPPELLNLFLASEEEYPVKLQKLDNFRLINRIQDQRSFEGFSNSHQFPHSDPEEVKYAEQFVDPDVLISRLKFITPEVILRRIDNFFTPDIKGLLTLTKDRILRIRRSLSPFTIRMEPGNLAGASVETQILAFLPRIYSPVSEKLFFEDVKNG